jgi:hypothetical protein
MDKKLALIAVVVVFVAGASLACGAQVGGARDVRAMQRVTVLARLHTHTGTLHTHPHIHIPKQHAPPNNTQPETTRKPPNNKTTKAPCTYDDPEKCESAATMRIAAPPPVGEDFGKSEWPELLGRPWREAKTVIETDRPELTVIVVPPGSVVTQDWREDRVWLFIDADENVVKLPRIG